MVSRAMPALALMALVLLAASMSACDEALPTPTPAPTAAPTPTQAPTPTPTPVPTSTTPIGGSADSDSTPPGEAIFSCSPFMGHMLDYTPHVLLWTPDGSHLVFSYGSVIWTVDEQGARLRMVLDANPVDLYLFSLGFVDFLHGFHADLSPDGAQLAYTSCQFPTEYQDPAMVQAVIDQNGQEWYERDIYNYEIAVTGLDGGSQQRITHRHSINHYPVWSPDGDRIAFIGGGGSLYKGYLYTMSPDGSDVQSAGLVDMDIAHVPPVWSPDGRRLAFVASEGVSFAPKRRNVHTVRPDGSELVKVGEMGALRFAYSRLTAAPTWSPDGERLAFQGFNGEELAIYTVRFDGSDLRPVWNGNDDIYPKSVSQVSWSPDGSELLIVGDGVHVLHLDGGGLRQLAVPVDVYTVAAWSPDGSRVAVYKISPLGSTGLYTVSRDGTDLRILVEADRNDELQLAQSTQPEAATDPATSSPGAGPTEPTATAPGQE